MISSQRYNSLSECSNPKLLGYAYATMKIKK